MPEDGSAVSRMRLGRGPQLSLSDVATPAVCASSTHGRSTSIGCLSFLPKPTCFVSVGRAELLRVVGHLPPEGRMPQTRAAGVGQPLTCGDAWARVRRVGSTTKTRRDQMQMAPSSVIPEADGHDGGFGVGCYNSIQVFSSGTYRWYGRVVTRCLTSSSGGRVLAA